MHPFRGFHPFPRLLQFPRVARRWGGDGTRIRLPHGVVVTGLHVGHDVHVGAAPAAHVVLAVALHGRRRRDVLVRAGGQRAVRRGEGVTLEAVVGGEGLQAVAAAVAVVGDCGSGYRRRCELWWDGAGGHGFATLGVDVRTTQAKRGICACACVYVRDLKEKPVSTFGSACSLYLSFFVWCVVLSCLVQFCWLHIILKREVNASLVMADTLRDPPATANTAAHTHKKKKKCDKMNLRK